MSQRGCQVDSINDLLIVHSLDPLQIEEARSKASSFQKDGIGRARRKRVPLCENRTSKSAPFRTEELTLQFQRSPRVSPLSKELQGWRLLLFRMGDSASTRFQFVD